MQTERPGFGENFGHVPGGVGVSSLMAPSAGGDSRRRFGCSHCHYHCSEGAALWKSSRALTKPSPEVLEVLYNVIDLFTSIRWRSFQTGTDK